MHATRRDDDSDFARTTSAQVQAQAARSLSLLSAIEAAVTRAHSNATLLRAIALEFGDAAAGLSRAERSALLDPEGRANDLLLKAAAAAERIHAEAILSMRSAQEDHRLNEEDGVGDAFAALAAAASDVHDAVENYRDAIATIDALSSPVGEKVYTNADDLFADIASGS